MQLGSQSLQQIVMKHRIGPQKVVMDLHQSCNLDIILANLDQGSGKKSINNQLREQITLGGLKIEFKLYLKLVFKELNHLAAILHVCAWSLISRSEKKNIYHFSKINTFTLLIIFIVKSLKKEQSSTKLTLNLL